MKTTKIIVAIAVFISVMSGVVVVVETLADYGFFKAMLLGVITIPLMFGCALMALVPKGRRDRDDERGELSDDAQK